MAPRQYVSIAVMDVERRWDDHPYLVVMILGGIQDGDVAFIEGLAGALEAVVYLVCDIQAARACAWAREGKAGPQQSRYDRGW